MILRILNRNVINNKSKANVASMFLYNPAIFYWFKDDANKLLFNHNLNKESTVFDLGAYKGNWSLSIYEKYQCNLYAFEPILEYSNEFVKRAKKYKKIKIFNFGLGDSYQELNVEPRGVQTTTLKEVSEHSQKIIIKDILSIKGLSKGKINLMHVNIEGGEYNLLKRLIETQIIEVIECLEIQFHEWYPSLKLSHDLRNEIHKSLIKTHSLEYSYDFVWEKWNHRSILR